MGRSVAEKGLLEVSLTRRIAASPEAVFHAWTDADQLASWCGPKGSTSSACIVDARVGGALRIEVCSPDGEVCPVMGRFVEVDRPHRLVFVTAALDEAGEKVFEVLNTGTFRAVDGGTEISLVAEMTRIAPDAPLHLSGLTQGWSQSLDRLVALVAQRQTRVNTSEASAN
jgi:uncharacterized protein YndB with AHSA1/START domain